MRNVIVSGGTRGLGLATSCALASAGYRVISVARNCTEEFAASAKSCTDLGGAMEWRPFDLAETNGIADFVHGLTQEFGCLHGLVNNAGLGTSGILATMQNAQIERLIRLNVVSPIILTKYVVRSMMVAGGGCIVNISSVVASTGYSGLAVYASSKAALTGLTRSLARELGPLGITVNTVAPGFVETDMTGGVHGAHLAKIAGRSALKRLAKAKDVAYAVQYLFSEQACNITGTTVTVDAGNTA